jgi:hypothetical protein
LFRTSLPELDNALKTCLPGLRTRIAGVFCHGRPKVDFTAAGKNHRCELGDLLIVVRFTAGHVRSDRAVLIQTKVGAPSYPDKPGEAGYEQYLLYTRWPRFRYSAKSFGRDVREIRPPEPHAGAQYGFLDVCQIGCDDCGARVAIPHAASAPQLAELITDMIFGSAGRSALLPPGDTSGFSRTVWDLISRSSEIAYRWRKGKGDGDRAFNEGLFLYSPDGLPTSVLRAAAFELVESGASGVTISDAIAAWEDERLRPPGDDLGAHLAEDAWRGPPGDDAGPPAGFSDDPGRGPSIISIEVSPRAD